MILLLSDAVTFCARDHQFMSLKKKKGKQATDEMMNQLLSLLTQWSEDLKETLSI